MTSTTARLGTASVTVLLAVIISVGAAVGSSQQQADALRRNDATLAQRSRSALLQLYALQSQLSEVQSSLGSIHAQSATLARERAQARTQLGIARHALRISQKQLGTNIRALYETSGVDPLAILLGANSLDDAITGLDGLNRAASQNRSVIEQTRSARGKLERIGRVLAGRDAALGRLEAAAAQSLLRLEGARAERSDTIARLASERRLNAGQIATLERPARAIQATAAKIAPPASATPVTSAPDTSGFVANDVAAPIDSGAHTITVTATGYALSGSTATGLPVGWGVAAVDPSVIPLGTHFSVPGYGDAVAADTGGAVRGATIDLWFPTSAQALAWGRRTVTLTLR